MITFKAIVISNNKRKDGTFPVKIRITFKGVSRRLPTTMVCSPSDLTRSLKIKNPDILNKAEELIIKMRNTLSDISYFDLENRDIDWVVNHIKQSLSVNVFKLDFFDWADSYILSKKETTRRNYIVALNSFERFLGQRKCDINSISKQMLLDYVDSQEKENKLHYCKKTGVYSETKKEKVKGSSIRKINLLSNIFSAARNKYNDDDVVLIPKTPFDYIPKAVPVVRGQRNLGKEIMQTIISAQTDNEKERIALDAFIVSFALMGANLADLYEAKPFEGNVWIYKRVKTRDRRSDGAEMRVEVPEELQPYMERLKAGTSRSAWLPVLKEISPKKDYCSISITKRLQSWCKKNNIQEFTFYAARHTWASLARKEGVEKALVDECLAHKGDYDMADVYAERSWDLMAKANRTVLNLFKW